MAAAGARGDAHVGARPVPDRRRPGRREDAPGDRVRARAARHRSRAAHRRRLPDRPADAPVGDGRRRRGPEPPAGRRAPGAAAGLRRDRGHLRARRPGGRCAGLAGSATTRSSSRTRRTTSATSWRGASRFEAACGGSRDRWLLLSGTPFRSDQCAIPGVRYDSGGVAECDIAYSYADAVRDRICRPVEFIPYDGRLQWRSGDKVVDASFSDELSGPRGRAPLPHRDLGRPSRRAAADPRRGQRASRRAACGPAEERRRARRRG